MSPNVAIILGTGSGGIGAHIARQYLSRTSLQVVALSRDAKQARESILSAIGNTRNSDQLDSNRLHPITLDSTSESSFASAASEIEHRFGKGCLKTYWNLNGILYPEKNLGQLDLDQMTKMFQVNTFSHLIGFKHFVPLIPKRIPPLDGNRPSSEEVSLFPKDLSTIVSLSARVGSIGDNAKGGWYSYRASKAALNQAIKTLSLELQLRKTPAIAVALHPGTVRTYLSRDFTGGLDSDKPLDRNKGQFEVWEAAENLIKVVSKLDREDNGSFRDWKGETIHW